MRRYRKLLALAVLWGASHVGAHGQDFQFPLNVTGVQMVDIPGMVVPDVLRGGSLPDGRSPDSKQKMAALNGKPVTGNGATRQPVRLAYEPTAALRRQTVAGYVNRLKTNNPGAAQALAAELGKYDYSQIYRSNTKDSGLRENDAADNMAALLLLGWMIVNDQHDGNAITVPMAKGVRAQVAPGLATSGAANTPAKAARVGEELKLLLVVLQAGWLSAPKEGQQVAFRQGVAAMFKTQYGFDLSKLRLTDQGFARK